MFDGTLDDRDTSSYSSLQLDPAALDQPRCRHPSGGDAHLTKGSRRFRSGRCSAMHGLDLFSKNAVHSYLEGDPGADTFASLIHFTSY
jgi:hypothetical protein